MIELVIAESDFDVLSTALLNTGAEGAGVLFANEVRVDAGRTRLLVHAMRMASDDDYTRRGVLEAELSPRFVAAVTKDAIREGYALVFVHSHPGIQAPRFSTVDDAGEQHLIRFLDKRHPTPMHAAMVVSLGGLCARRLGGVENVAVTVIGPGRRIVHRSGRAVPLVTDAFDRQVRAFGAEGQLALQELRIGIVGLGGTGSIVAEQLAHLGVRDFVLVDPDSLETTNLNRVAGARAEDVGRPKVAIARDHVHSVASDVRVDAISGDVIRTRVARRLLDVDLLFGCTDSHGSRAILQQLAYQYMIPYIDLGTTIIARDGHVSYVIGRVQLLVPGLACFVCDGLLDPNEVRRDMMTAFERQSDPYLQGAREPAPAVMSINGTVASLAVTMSLSLVCGIPANGRHLLYDAISPRLRSVRAVPNPSCYICSAVGARARGDSWPINGRAD
jgi:molybdopterin/thiamine biosynthesis adenylyltransferase